MNGLKKIKTTRTRIASAKDVAVIFEPGERTPNELCDAVRNAIISLPLDSRAPIKERLLSAIQSAKLNVGSILLLLGIHAESVDDLTPSDVAYLVRYIRINSPQALQALSKPLSELFEMAGPAQGVQESRRAA